MKMTLPLLYTQENPRRIRFLIGLDSNSENFPNQPEYACRLTDPSTGRPCRSTVPNSELGNVSRSTAIAYERWCTPVDRPGRPVLLLLLLLILHCFLIVVDFLDFLATSSLFLQFYNPSRGIQYLWTQIQ